MSAKPRANATAGYETCAVLDHLCYGRLSVCSRVMTSEVIHERVSDELCQLRSCEIRSVLHIAHSIRTNSSSSIISTLLVFTSIVQPRMSQPESVELIEVLLYMK